MAKDADHQLQPALWDAADRPEASGSRSRSTQPRAAAAGAGELWTIDQVADYLGVPKQTIYCWRTTGYGPQGFRVGKHLRWRATTVLGWVTDLEGRS